MSCERAKIYGELYASAVESTLKAAANVPEDKRFRQAADGKAHPLWLMGHLAMTFDMLVNHWMLGLDLEIPREWGRAFGPTQFGGNPITPDADAYPAWDTILEAYKKAGTRAAEKIATLNESDFALDALGPMPDQFKVAFGKLGKSIPDDALHDAHHRGQLMMLCGLD